jgi:hypothetical protein
VADFEKRVDPGATIQLDKIDAMDLVQFEEERLAKLAESEQGQPPTSRRTAPPPLPPTSISMPATPTAEPRAAERSTSPPQTARTVAPPTSKGKSVVYGAVFLVLLGGAIALGLVFGARLRGGSAGAAAASAAPLPAPSTPASSHAINIAPVEITGP